MAAALTITGLRKAFGDILALDRVDLEVERGELVGFLGPNGAGKTTTMRGVVGLTAIDAGSVLWQGRPITEDDRRHIGYLPQERGLYARMGVHEHIAYFGRLAGLDSATAANRADHWAERVGLEGRRDDLVQALSTGNQQRVQLAIALVHEPDLLLLDEPFAGLDPLAVAMLSEVMKEQVERGASVVFSSHQLDLVQDLAENVTIIAAGRTRATGSVTDLRLRSPYRILDINWAGPAPDWMPVGATALTSRSGSSRYKVPADSDPAETIAAAANAAALASVSLEPPGLEAVFLEMVAS